MIIKKLTCDPDPQRALRRRSRLCVAVFALGVLGLACSRLLLNKSALPDFAQGFYTAVSCGLMLAGALLFVRCRYLMAHPDKARAQNIREQDEREQLISQKAMSTAGLIVFFLLAAALLITVPLDRTVCRTLALVLFAWWLILASVRAVYARRL